MTFGYYPGCALRGSSLEYDESVLRISGPLGWGLREIADWNCCGASAGHMTDHSLTAGISARNLFLAEQQGLEEILVPCPMCSVMLFGAREELTGKSDVGRKITEAIGTAYQDKVEILNLIQVFQRTGLDTLKEKVVRPLEGLRVACYYGCLLVRPPKLVQFDDPEDPTSMEEIVEILGADPVQWPLRTDCCGAGFTVSARKSVIRLTGEILVSAKDAGADVVAVACPMCQANLDMMQRKIEKSLGRPINLPILYLSQLAGLALGISPEELGIHRHFVEVPTLFRGAATPSVETARARGRENEHEE